MKILWLAFIVSLFLPAVHASLVVSELGSTGGDLAAICSADFDKNGVPETAVVGTIANAMAFGAYSWTKPVQNVKDVTAVDMNSDGYMDEVVVAGKDIVAFSLDGSELWRAEKYSGYSITGADLDGDGYSDEAVAGCWNKIAAFDSSGNSLWNYTGISGNVKTLALTKYYIIAGAGKMVYAVDFDGDLRWSKAVPNTISALTAVDLDGGGDMDGVVVAVYDGDGGKVSLEVFTMYGSQKNWTVADQFHEATVDVNMFPVDKYSKGNLGYTLFNLDLGIYWLSNTGGLQKIQMNYPAALSPIDFDKDGIMDDVIVGTRGDTGKLYAYSAIGQMIGNSTYTGADMIVAVDLDYDGKTNDAIVASDFDKKVYSVISQVSDSTTSSTPVTTTPAPTTTAPPTTTPAPTTAAPGTTAPPATTAAPAGAGISVDLGSDQSVAKGTEVTLTASATPSTSGGTIVTYIWTEGTSLLTAESNKQSISKVFEAGTHEVNVVVTDNTGATANDTVTITVTDGASASGDDSDSDGWNDALEAQMGTDPNNPDTDGDGILDAKDPNPLVAGGGGSALGGATGTLVGIIKWVVIIGGVIVAAIFIREKILDLMWEKDQDWGE